MVGKRRVKLLIFDPWVFDRQGDILKLSLDLPGIKRGDFSKWVQNQIEAGLILAGIDPHKNNGGTDAVESRGQDKEGLAD